MSDRTGKPWTVEGEYDDGATLRSMAAEGKDRQEIAAATRRTYYAVKEYAKRHKIEIRDRPVGPRFKIDRIVSETPDRVVYSPSNADEEPIDKVWERSVRATERKIGKIRSEGLALIRLVTDRPVALSISSDWHISPSGGCDLEGLKRYAETIQQTPGAFAVAVGDLSDNPIKWSKNMDDVPDEVRLIDHIFGIFGSKLLATTDGNHDAWSRQFAGVDNIRRLSALNRVHYAADELVYIVELASTKDPTGPPTARYVIATRHQYRRNSSLNWTHACWRWFEDNVNDWPKGEDGGTLLPDIVAIGHNHVAAVENRSYEGGERWAARMGPFQIHSSHGRQYGWARGVPTCPTFILHPHRAKPITGYAEYERALEALSWERADAAA